MNYTILAIETSLDDTCAAVTQDDRVMTNVVASQVAFHAEWGGTVPHIAKRKHVEWIDKIVEEALRKAGIKIPPLSPPNLGEEKVGVDAIAVTYGPGLAPCLEVGIAKAKELAVAWNKPLIAVNHMEGHLLASFAKNAKGNQGITAPLYPLLGFLISGGHTELVLMKAMGQYELLGETLDDAAGEAYDKVARMLNLGYPGGPILAEMAKGGEPIYKLPEPMRDRKDLNFSFSGLKTAAMNKLRELSNPLPEWEQLSLRERTRGDDRPAFAKATTRKQFIADFAASFEAAVLAMMRRRLKRAIERHQPKMVILGGGVVSNLAIRNMARETGKKYGLKIFKPYTNKLFTDNAAMIGVAAWYKAQRGEFVKDTEGLDRQPNLNFQPVGKSA